MTQIQTRTMDSDEEDNEIQEDELFTKLKKNHERL